MKKFFVAICMAMMPFISFSQEHSSIIGRPYKNFDTSAFCAFNTFHPSQYLTDNNWEILCAFVEPGSVEKLDSLGISYNKSQLRLLEVGDLLSCEDGTYTTVMKIFDKPQTDVIRQQSRQFADSIFPAIEPAVRQLISEFSKAGYSRQLYSLVFSYLLDSYIWDDERLASPLSCGDHGTWSGAYWAMFDSRDHDKIGTNGFGPVKQNWTENLGYWLSANKLAAFSKEVVKTKGNRIDNRDVIDAIAGWGLTDENGNILIPVIHANNNDSVDILCKSITDKLSDAVKQHCASWSPAYGITSERLGQVIFYHEVMWDLLDILESKKLISMPAILKGEEVGKQHFGDICFIVIDDSDN